VALIAGAGFASAAEGAKDQPAMKGSAAAPAKNEPAMKHGADIKAGAAMKGKAETTGAGVESKSEMKAEPKANLKADGKVDTKSKPGTTGAGASDKTEMKSSSDTKARTGMDSKAESDNKAGATKAGADSKSNAAAADTKAGASGSASLTTEQKTKIRTTVLQSSSAPKVSRSSINFNLSVGTVVPRSVHFVAVPPALVEIHPAWRGYSYFIVDDEIVIVDARTMKIIAVVVV
jgi:hypothetical protein